MFNKSSLGQYVLIRWGSGGMEVQPIEEVGNRYFVVAGKKFRRKDGKLYGTPSGRKGACVSPLDDVNMKLWQAELKSRRLQKLSTSLTQVSTLSWLTLGEDRMEEILLEIRDKNRKLDNALNEVNDE